MKKYFLHDGTNQYGPFDLEELQRKIITAQTLIWFEPMTEWKPAAEIDEVKHLINNKVPERTVIIPPTVAAREEDWTRKQYFYADSNGQQGPFTLEQLKNKGITADTAVWYDPLPEWTTADKVAGLKDVIISTVVAPKVEPKEEVTRQYYFTDSAGQQGPFTLEQLKGKPITASTPVWYDPLPQWTTAGALTELKDIISSTTSTAGSFSRQYYYTDSTGQQGPFTLEQLKGKPVYANTPVWYEPLPQWTTAGQVIELTSIIVTGTTSVAEDWSRKQIYYTDSTGQKGPFTLDQLRGRGITANTPVWYEPLTQWTTAGQVPALRDIINNTTPVANISTGNRQYYYTDGTGQQGPFTLEQLRSKPINANTPVWYDPLTQWTTAGQVSELRDIINRTAAPGVMQEDWNSKQYYYTDNMGQQQGPFTLNQLRGKGITFNTPVWYDPLPQWTTAGKVQGLKDVIIDTAAIPRPLEEDWSKKQYFYTDSTGQHGPYSLEQLMGKGITANTPIWYDPLPQWTTAGKVAGLRSIIV